MEGSGGSRRGLANSTAVEMIGARQWQTAVAESVRTAAARKLRMAQKKVAIGSAAALEAEALTMAENCSWQSPWGI